MDETLKRNIAWKIVASDLAQDLGFFRKEGLRERVEKLADRAGVSRPEMAEFLIEVLTDIGVVLAFELSEIADVRNKKKM